MNYMIRLEIGLEIRHGGVISVCALEDKTAVVVVASRNIAMFQEIPFVSRLSAVDWIDPVFGKESRYHLLGVEASFLLPNQNKYGALRFGTV